VRALAIGIVILFAAFLLTSAVAIVRRFYLIGSIIAFLAKIGIFRGRLRPDMAWINRMEDLLLIVLRDSPRRFSRITVVELAAQALLVLELLWLMRVLDIVTLVSFVFVIEPSGSAVAFLRRARSLAVAGIGLSTLAVVTRHRERRAA
jgi:hypothetical protein